MKDFWRRYLSEDELSRLELLKSIAKVIDGCRCIDDDKHRLHCISSLLDSYLQDFTSVLLQELKKELKGATPAGVSGLSTEPDISLI